MSTGTHGMNRRAADRAPRETYLTPTWAWEWFFARFRPLPGTVIVDPATGGWNGWTAGGRWASIHGREALLSDLHPLAGRCRFTQQPIKAVAYEDLALPPGPSYSLLTNGPFPVYPRWLGRALASCEEVVLLVRAGWLFAGDGLRVRHLHSYWQPARRMAFLLLPEEGDRRETFNQEYAEDIREGRRKALDVVRASDEWTGYQCSATGVDHGFAVWRRGYEGIPALMVESATAPSRQLDLFTGAPALPPRVCSDDRLTWVRGEGG